MKSRLRRILAKPEAKLSLADLQTLMAAGILNQLTRGFEASDDIKGLNESAQCFASRFIKPNSKLSARARLAIYNRQYWYRLLDALHDDLPGLRWILGDDRFYKLCRAYLEKYPSESFTLRDLPLRLESFMLKSRTSFRFKAALEMARFEIAQIIAFDGQERPRLNLKDIAGKAPGRVRLGLQPYLSLLELNWPFDELAWAVLGHERQQSEAGAALRRDSRRAGPLPRRRKIFLAVHRFGDAVYFKRLSAAQRAVLRGLGAGDTLAQACAAGERCLIGRKGRSADLESLFRDWFSEWASLGWLTKRYTALSRRSSRK